MLFISTGEKTALPAMVVPFAPVTPTPAPVEVVSAPVVATAPVAVVAIPVVIPVVATVVPVAVVAIATPPPVVPLVITGVGAELIDEFTVTCGLVINAGETNCPPVG